MLMSVRYLLASNKTYTLKHTKKQRKKLIIVLIIVLPFTIINKNNKTIIIIATGRGKRYKLMQDN